MNNIYEYDCNGEHGDYNIGDECEILGFTYQDYAPVVWTLNCNTKRIVGCNPSDLKFKMAVRNDS